MARASSSGKGRGREAERPRQISKHGWIDVFSRVKNEMSNDHVTMIAAGVAFYGLLAIFPLIAALISIWGLAFDPETIQRQIETLSNALPQGAAGIIKGQAEKVAEGAGGGVSLAVLGGVLLTLYSASKGMKALMEGLNVIYDEDESRGFIMQNVVALTLTLGLILVMIVSLALIVVVPAWLGNLGLGQTATALVTYLRWPILFVVAMLGLAILYKFASARARPQWRWVSWGAVIATLLWVAGSIGFSLYVRNFASYNETYGSLGAVVILLMWFWLSAFIVLMGAELNSEMEHQTERDTTSGEKRPMGKRGAHAADTVGEKA